MGEATLKGLNAKQVGLIIAVMAVYFFAPTQGIISSVLGEIGKSYPNISDATLTYLITLNNIMAVPAAFFFGLWAGRKFKFKTLSIIAMLCFIVGGGLPVFLPQNAPFWIMFSTRGIIGLGRGCFIPIVQITLSAMFRDEKTRSAWFGFGSVLFNLGATFGVAIAGILAVFDWRYCFAFYLFAAIPLGLYAIFFHEEDVSDYIASTESGMKAFKFPGICWAYFVLYALAIIISQTMFNYGGLTMSHLGFSTVQSGFVLSCFTIAASLIGLVFSFIFRVCKNFIMALGIGIMTLGMLVFFIASETSSLGLFYVASCVVGIGCSIVTVGCPLSMSITVAPATVTAALSFNEVFHNGGSFLASPWSQLVFGIFPNAPTHFVFLATAVLSLILTIAAIAVGFKVRAQAKAIAAGKMEMVEGEDLSEHKAEQAAEEVAEEVETVVLAGDATVLSSGVGTVNPVVEPDK